MNTKKVCDLNQIGEDIETANQTCLDFVHALRIGREIAIPETSTSEQIRVLARDLLILARDATDAAVLAYALVERRRWVERELASKGH